MLSIFSLSRALPFSASRSAPSVLSLLPRTRRCRYLSAVSSSSSPLPLSALRIQPVLLAAFTCIHCEHRSTRRVSRQAYREGVVLARCGGCQRLHLLADHLKWFDDQRSDIESIMKEKGFTVTRGALNMNSKDEKQSSDSNGCDAAGERLQIEARNTYDSKGGGDPIENGEEVKRNEQTAGSFVYQTVAASAVKFRDHEQVVEILPHTDTNTGVNGT